MEDREKIDLIDSKRGLSVQINIWIYYIDEKCKFRCPQENLTHFL